MSLDPSKFPLRRFRPGEKVFVWKGVDRVDGSSAHGKRGTVRKDYAELDDGRRVYFDSETCFMTEEEFAVFDVMGS